MNGKIKKSTKNNCKSRIMNILKQHFINSSKITYVKEKSLKLGTEDYDIFHENYLIESILDDVNILNNKMKKWVFLLKF